MRFVLVLFLISICILSCDNQSNDEKQASIDVLSRSIGEENLTNFELQLEPDDKTPDWFNLQKKENKIIVKGNSQIALCRGVYDYLKNECNSIISWSGSKISIPEHLPEVDRTVESPYQFRYYFNVVTHGYTTPYWDWNRWEKEIDWMAVHGINMPLIGGAHEAILARVFQKLGLSKSEMNQYFSGPAYFPWNRMGNLNGWDGPLPKSYFQKQITLTHQMLTRMETLGMSPIVHAFAGFVPKGLKRLYPNEEIRELAWGGGLPLKNNGFILSPTSPLFKEIGTLYIQEWEKEFGKGEYYLADSFNEMDAPLSKDSTKALKELAGYGASVYQSIKEANPDATWVMQGWTFPYHKDENGKLFWTPERLGALVQEVPDDKLLILDLANEYNHVFWKIDPSWKMYNGFFGKKWIYSFIPNMGGKIPLNGKLDVYASIPFDALNYENKKNLVGFGFAPEGIENNEIIYELLSDVAWKKKKFSLDNWIENYCKQRYGAYPSNMKKAYDLLNKSAYGSFTDHPMHRYQFRPYKKPEGVENHATVHISEEFREAVGAFICCSNELKDSNLYTFDAIEIVVQYLGLEVDQRLMKFLESGEQKYSSELDEIMKTLLVIDKLLATHPNYKLENWLNFSRKWGDTSQEKNYYESDAKRIVTTWGGDPVNDYSGRVWSGLIRDYYVPRWQEYYKDNSDRRKQNMREWEENWITTPGLSKIKAYDDPLKVAAKMYFKFEEERHANKK
ncbi:alpha-N-acetylglucosaminidase [Labilibaculum antarcticum]|uniref:Alpha-N-acetylglucosaminidase n=1 Tax=Labilibaculum antarcticum TaxID=1717717 RepID=A0A1Y1CGT7_9BACT|nr:alpha-N-acetylglucosaminidase [Labilibaculum antarcticum]BAX79303.1 alpha-N-acetylglucosaminidase [Labilibaculum antarcticum]